MPDKGQEKLQTDVHIGAVKLPPSMSPGVFIGRGGEGINKASEVTMCAFDVVERNSEKANRGQKLPAQTL